MFNVQTFLREEIIRYLTSIDIVNINILEIGGSAKNKSLFKQANYYSIGYEGDINLDLNNDFSGYLKEIKFDYIIISTTMMYMDDTKKFLSNCISYLDDGSKLLIMEAFIYPQTNHKSITDTNRLTFDYVIKILKDDSKLTITYHKRIGGLIYLIFSLLTDIFPSCTKKYGGNILLRIGYYLDYMSLKMKYFKKRQSLYYQGYIIEAKK